MSDFKYVDFNQGEYQDGNAFLSYTRKVEHF